MLWSYYLRLTIFRMRSYPSKVILFGEHSLLYGGEGLALPGRDYCGHWNRGNAQHFGTDLFRLAEYLLVHAHSFNNSLNVPAFLKDAEDGWFFDSNIPVGYGSGSSGAYSAALYDRYGDIKNRDTEKMKADMALIESYFHGQSSGIDPLVSYCNRPFHFVDGMINEASLSDDLTGHFKLVDTRIPRHGSTYIEMFGNKMNDKVFADKIYNTLIPAVSNAIEATLENDQVRLKNLFFEISYFQLVWMPEFIPLTWIRTWEHRLSENTGFLKLCGAGGGGFLLEYRG